MRCKRAVARAGEAPVVTCHAARTCATATATAAHPLVPLASVCHRQAGIVQLGGLPPLLELLESKHYNLQHNAAFALYGESLRVRK